jgi:colicin import membrane protein
MRALALLFFLVVVVAAPAAAQTSAIRPLTPEPPASQTQQVEALMRERRFEQALERADAILARNPRNAQVRFQRAVILSDLKRLDEAIGALEALAQDFPELPEPYNNLAVLHAAAGRYELARSLLQRSLEVQPNYVTAYENLGDLYVSMAADAYQRGLKLAPGSTPLQSKLTLARETGARLRSLP